jgi:COP9 signalosome complex subunit 7
LIVRATSAPNTYIFTELLQTPQVQALASSPEFAPFLTLLQIFSHGTYSSYTSTPGLPELNEAQRLKLRQLSLLTLAKKDSRTSTASSPALDYASLQKALDLPSRQALEELVISAVYAGLLKAQLNPKASVVQINSVSPLRDVAPSDISDLLASLQAWAGRCDATLESLSAQMNQVRAEADRRAARAAARAEETHKLMEKEQKGGQVPNRISYQSATPRFLRSGGPAPTMPISARTLNSDPSSTTNSMNSMLTVGGGSSFFAPAGARANAAGAVLAQLQVSAAADHRSGLDDAEKVDMDVDDEDDSDGKKRAGKRKLGALSGEDGSLTT